MLVFCLMMVIWFWIEPGYARFFRAMGNALVGLGTDGNTWYAPFVEADQSRDTELILRDSKARQQRRVHLSSRRLGYLPTAFLISLVLAYPLSRSRRWRALLWSMAWVHVWIACIFILYPVAYGDLSLTTNGASQSNQTGILQYVLGWVISGSSVGWMLVPLLIWCLVCFRPADWVTLTGRNSTNQPDHPT